MRISRLAHTSTEKKVTFICLLREYDNFSGRSLRCLKKGQSVRLNTHNFTLVYKGARDCVLGNGENFANFPTNVGVFSSWKCKRHLIKTQKSLSLRGFLSKPLEV